MNSCKRKILQNQYRHAVSGCLNVKGSHILNRKKERVNRDVTKK